MQVMGKWKAVIKQLAVLVIVQSMFVWMLSSWAFASGAPTNLDKGLEAAIRQELALNDSTPITGNEIRILTKLDASNRNILSLEGLENAVFVKELSLEGNYILDLSVLTKLPNLKVLTINKNQFDQATIFDLVAHGIEVNFIEEQEKVNLPIQVFYNGESVSFSEDPVTVDNYTMVQFRPLFETFGLQIGWDQATQTISGNRDQLSIKMVIGSETVTVNGKPFTLPVAPRLIDGSTMIPLRFIGEVTGNIVKWDGSTRTVSINSSIASYNLEIIYSNDTTYEGDTTAGNPDGNGKLYYKGSLFYEGEFKDGIIEGLGKMYDVKNPASYYEGDFLNNRFHGQGKIVYDDGAYHIGTFAGGMREGTGKVYTAEGKLTFNGIFKNDSRNGQGWGLYGTDYKYEGMYADDDFHGQGKLYYQGQLSYDGEWNHGFQAQGKLYINHKLFYEGTYRNDKPHGYGAFYDQDGNITYRGQVSNWNQSGVGIIYNENGNVYVGEVLFGQADGEGILSAADATILHDGFFVNGTAFMESEEISFDDSVIIIKNLLMRSADHKIIDGIYENNMGLASNQAALFIILESEEQVELFNNLPNDAKKELMNEYVQQNWGEVLGVDDCITFVVLGKFAYAEANVQYDMESSNVEATFYPEGTLILE